MVSAYELDGFIVIYVANDQPTKNIKCDLKVTTVKWSDVSLISINIIVILLLMGPFHFLFFASSGFDCEDIH